MGLTIRLMVDNGVSDGISVGSRNGVVWGLTGGDWVRNSGSLKNQ